MCLNIKNKTEGSLFFFGAFGFLFFAFSFMLYVLCFLFFVFLKHFAEPLDNRPVGSYN